MSLRIEGLRHTYPLPAAEARTVLSIDRWTLEAGDQVLLRGVSGSGKTTLLNIIAGLLRPTAGSVGFDDQPLYALSEQARDRFRAQAIGYVMQTHHLLPALTALENVIAPMAFARALPPACWRDRAAHLLAQVGLAGFETYRPRQLSTGQRLRVAIARALANEPRLLLADEPTAALDAASSESVMDLMQETCRTKRAILILASHDPTLGARFATQVYLSNGCLSAAVEVPAT